MKVRSKRDLPKANRIFTDREQPRASFWKKYEEACSNPDNVSVLTYYGIGGIGKSSLLNKLRKEMAEKIKNPLQVYYDFEISADVSYALKSLRNMLANSYNFRFPLYDLALYVYAKRIGEDIDDHADQILKDSPFLTFVINAMGVIPIVGIAPQLLQMADKGVAFCKDLVRNHRRELNELEIKSPSEIFQMLPGLLAEDIADNMEKQKQPLVVFLDTYERLVNEHSSIGDPLMNDMWLRGENGLIQNIPNTLWVIAGREKIKWEKYDPDWSEALEQHILGILSHADGTRFLKEAGIEDDDLCDDIYELTQGTPVYLDLCVDRYYSLLERDIEPSIKEIGTNTAEVVERFIRYMDDDEKNHIYVLACMRTWNDEMISELGGELIDRFSILMYEKIKEFSFVLESNGGFYFLHQAVGDILLKNCAEAIRKKTLRKMLSYYSTKISATDVFCEEYCTLLTRFIGYMVAYENDDTALKDLYKENAEKYYQELIAAARYEDALHCIEPLVKRAEADKDSALYAEMLIDLADNKRNAGHYQESLAYATEAYELWLRKEGEESLNTLHALYTLGITLWRLGTYEEAYEKMKIVSEKRREHLGATDPETISAEHNLANILSAMGRHDETLALRREVLSKSREVLGEKHPRTLAAQNNLSITLYALGRYEEALDLRRDVYEKRLAMLGEKHLSTLTAQSNLAFALQKLGRYEEALSMHRQVVALRLEQLGENHPSVAEALEGVAEDLMELKRYEEALDTYRLVYEKRVEILGENHPKVVKTVEQIACLQNRQ